MRTILIPVHTQRGHYLTELRSMWLEFNTSRILFDVPNKFSYECKHILERRKKLTNERKNNFQYIYIFEIWLIIQNIFLRER